MSHFRFYPETTWLRRSRKTAAAQPFSVERLNTHRVETTRHSAFSLEHCVSAHRQKRSNLRKDQFLEVFAFPAKPIEDHCPRFSSPVAGAASTRLTLSELRSRCQTRVQRSALTASLADLNSYNKPIRVAQALRQTFFSFVFKNPFLS